MFTTLFLFALFALVSFPVVQEATPALVAKTALVVPQVVEKFTLLTPVQKKSVSAAIAVVVTYPTVYVAACFVEFLFVPVAWVALLFSALAIVPQTKTRATALLKQYIPCALKLIPEAAAVVLTNTAGTTTIPALPPKKISASSSSNDDDNGDDSNLLKKNE